MQFVLDDGESITVYSTENQALIRLAFNSGTDVVNVFHEIQDGPHKGNVVQHIIYLETRSVHLVGKVNAFACGRLKLVRYT